MQQETRSKKIVRTFKLFTLWRGMLRPPKTNAKCLRRQKAGDYFAFSVSYNSLVSIFYFGLVSLLQCGLENES